MAVLWLTIYVSLNFYKYYRSRVVRWRSRCCWHLTPQGFFFKFWAWVTVCFEFHVGVLWVPPISEILANRWIGCAKLPLGVKVCARIRVSQAPQALVSYEWCMLYSRWTAVCFLRLSASITQRSVWLCFCANFMAPWYSVLSAVAR